MTSWSWVCVILFIVVIVIFILIAAFPSCQPKNWNGGGGGRRPPPPQHHNHFATALRSQNDTTILAAIPILTTPTPIVFNRASASVSMLVPKSGTYTVSYQVQLAWTQEATVSAAVQMNSNTVEDLIGSQLQMTNPTTHTSVLSNTFLATLKKGATLTLLCKASIADSISVPASDSATLQTPTTLASLSFTEH